MLLQNKFLQLLWLVSCDWYRLKTVLCSSKDCCAQARCFGSAGPSWASAASCWAFGASSSWASCPSSSTSGRWPLSKTSASRKRRAWPENSCLMRWTNLTATWPRTAWSRRRATSSPWPWAPTSSGSTAKGQGLRRQPHPHPQTTTAVSRTRHDYLV